MARTPPRLLSLPTLAVLSLALLSGQGFAQESEPYYEDPPDRAARLSFISGDVSLQPADEEQWAPALVNRPLTTGDKLWTEGNSRAEIYVGPAAVRLDGETGFSFLNVDDDTIQMRITAGVMNVSVNTLADREHIEIDTPNVALSLLRAGNYRVEVNDAGDTTVVKVSEGSLQATGGSQDVVVYAQQAVTFRGTDELVAQFGTLGAPDDFDSWSLERDRRDEVAESSRTAEYVSPEVTGYQDLNEYGTWSSEPEYGYVWTPRYVAVGWAPYAYGRWVSISPWGWTWIDDAPWGYAPYHYGRWAHVRHRWCWVPGPRHVRAVYAPALVGWGGHHGGHVSWFPLGPRDVYAPQHSFSRRYWERVNQANTHLHRSSVMEIYADAARRQRYQNRAAPGGVTAVTRTAFTSAGRTAGNNRVRLSQDEVTQSDASAVAPRIAAGRDSRLGGTARANVRVPPRNIADRQVVVRRETPDAVARYARSVAQTRQVPRTPERRTAQGFRGLEQGQSLRPSTLVQDRSGQDRSTQDRSTQDRSAQDRPSQDRPVRDRSDRPPRAERPASEISPPASSSVFDRRALSDRVRQDRDRQVREGVQQREAMQQREALQQRENVYRERQPDQQSESPRQRWQSPAEQTREIRERAQAPRVEQPQYHPRERVQREPERQSAPRVEQPQYHQRERAEPPRERQQPREQPREQPRQQERSYQPPQRAERSSNDQGSQPKAGPRDNESRHNRR